MNGTRRAYGRIESGKRAESAAGARSSRPGSSAATGPDFWGRSTAVQLVDASVKNPELKLQLLTRALEESRAKVAAMQRDRAAVADALATLCASAGAEDRSLQAPAGEGDDVLPRFMDVLSTQLDQLQEGLRAKGAAVVEAEAAHERAALQVVAGQQQREGLERELEEARYTAQQQERALHAAHVKLGLLEEQLAATAESARRRMEEQLDTFRGEALTARTMRTRFIELGQQLEAAQRAQRAEADDARHLAAQLERLQGRLKEAGHKQAELMQQLWDKSTALSDLTAAHRCLDDDHQATVAENARLREALAASQQRAQRAEDLEVSQQARRAAGQEAQAALHDEVDQLRGYLQQERERAHRLQSALSEEQAAAATHRAALQGKTDEVASLLIKFEEYSNRIVAAEAGLEGATKQAAAAEATQRTAEEAARALRHEHAALRDSLADLAASESKWQQQAEQASQRADEAAAALAAAKEDARQQEENAKAAAQRAQRMLATLGEQALKLEGMAALQDEAQGLRGQVVDLTQELHAASAQARAAQAVADEVAAAKQATERELHKQEVLVQRLQEQGAKQAAELRGNCKELGEARAHAESVACEAAAQREAHAAELAAQHAAHEQRKIRNKALEHDNRQQAIIIAELQAAVTSALARLEATQQHNAALHRSAVAHGAAYGRLAAHSTGLHQQLARQLSALRQLCRHLSLQLESALLTAAPLAGLQSLADSTSSAGSASGQALSEGQPEGAQAAGVAAAVLAIESFHTELQVAVQLLDLQAGGAEAAQLAAVPAGIATALAADLAGLPAELLSSPRLEPAQLPASPGWAATRGLAGAAATPQPAATTLPAGGAPGAALPVDAELVRTGSSSEPPVGAEHAATHPSAARVAAPSQAHAGPSSVLSAQVAQMESHLERLVATGAEQAARTAAAAALLEREQGGRRRAQELAGELSTQLAAVQADLASARGQRDEQQQTSQRLARELRDAIYTLSQLHAQQQGQAVSWTVRGLSNVSVQTQYCRLWEANLGCACSSCCGASSEGERCAPDTNARGADASSVLCTARSTDSSTGSTDGGSGAAACSTSVGADLSTGAAAGCDPGPVRVLPLPSLQRQIKEIYRAKALHDLAVTRGQKPCLPLPDFVAAHLALQSGADGRAVAQRAQQLQASVEAHAGVYEVAMFGLSAGMLEEAASGLAPVPGGRLSSGSHLMPAGPTAERTSCSPLHASGTAAAAAVPLVLYHGRHRNSGTASDPLPASQGHGVLHALRRFCAANWHAAYQRSAARLPLAQPCSPAAADHIHAMCSEVHNLALSVPGVEQLMCWVLGGGVAACLPALDLGLRLAENQVPQLYLLAAESCRVLGLAGTPQLFIKSSNEAAAYYLMLPSATRLHGMNGSAAGEAGRHSTLQPSAANPGSAAGLAAQQTGLSPPSTAGSGVSNASSSEGLTLLQPTTLALQESSGAGAGLRAAAAAEAHDWQCAVVLTSALVDLLEPEELQAVMASCLAFHAALLSPHTWNAGDTAPHGAAQLAVLCRSMAALGTLGALSTLCPDALACRLPHQMAPFLHSRIHPLLRRCLRHLSLYCDRVAADVVGGWHTVATAAIKQAAGSCLLRNELSLQAVLQQATELEEASAELLPKAALREDAATLAGASASWTLLRVRELQKWCGGGAAVQR